MNAFYYMRKSMALAAAVIAAGLVSAEAATPSSVSRFRSVMERNGAAAITRNFAATAMRGSSAIKRLVRTAETPVMRPAWEVNYYNDNGWTEMGRADYQYDAQGNPVRVIAVDDGQVATILMEYDAFGQRTLLLTLAGSGDDARNESKRTYRYDPVVHDFCVERMGYDWSGSDWQPNYFCETNEVTRNAAGNITEILKSLPYQGAMMPAYHSVWEYAEPDGAPTGFRYYMNMTGEDVDWLLYNDTYYSDLKWNRTDGQPTIDILEMVEGRNRISEATVYYKDLPDGYIFVSYPEGDEPGYYMVMTTNNPEEIGYSQRLETLEADDLTLQYTASDYVDPDTDEIASEPTYQFRNITAYDSHGNPLYSENYDILPGAEPEMVSGERYAYTYDADGNLTESIQSVYSYDDGEYFEENRNVYGDYIDVTSGVDGVQSASALRISGLEATAEGIILVYAADGRLVARADGRVDLSGLAAGCYVIRSGADTLRFIR